MKRFVTAVLLAGALTGAPGAARANMRVEPWRGHISIGYAHVFSDSLAPPGSISFGAGLDYPLTPNWRVGPAMSFSMLGSSTVVRGSIPAAIDYNLFEAALLFTHLNAHGPVARWSVGPGLGSPRASISVAAGGLGFRDLTLSGVRPELAADITFISRHKPIVAVGAELAARVIPIPSHATWTQLSARLAIHF